MTGRRGIRDPAVVDPLLGALRDADAEVRAEAATRLAAFDDPRIVPALTPALADPDPEARQKIERAGEHAGARRPATSPQSTPSAG